MAVTLKLMLVAILIIIPALVYLQKKRTPVRLSRIVMANAALSVAFVLGWFGAISNSLVIWALTITGQM